MKFTSDLLGCYLETDDGVTIAGPRNSTDEFTMLDHNLLCSNGRSVICRSCDGLYARGNYPGDYLHSHEFDMRIGDRLDF